VLRMGLLPPSKQLADECDRELLLEIAISPSFDPTLSYVRSHLVPPTTHAERTEARRKDGEDDLHDVFVPAPMRHVGKEIQSCRGFKRLPHK
jgi:hypothetical protein